MSTEAVPKSGMEVRVHERVALALAVPGGPALVLPVDRGVVGRQLGLQLPGDRDRQGPLVRLHHERGQRCTPGAEHLGVVEGRNQVALGLLGSQRLGEVRHRDLGGPGQLGQVGDRPGHGVGDGADRAAPAGPEPSTSASAAPVAARACVDRRDRPGELLGLQGIDGRAADDGRLTVEADGRRADLGQRIQRARCSRPARAPRRAGRPSRPGSSGCTRGRGPPGRTRSGRGCRRRSGWSRGRARARRCRGPARRGRSARRPTRPVIAATWVPIAIRARGASRIRASHPLLRIAHPRCDSERLDLERPW